MKYLFILLGIIIASILIPRLLKSKKEYIVEENVYNYIDLLGKEEPEEETSEDIQLIDSLVETYERTFDHNILLTIGQMYARGSFPRYSPDETSALNIYKVASTCPDPEVAGMAMAKIIETRFNPIPDEDKRGPSFPLETAKRIVSCAENHIKSLPLSMFMKKSSHIDYNKARKNTTITHVEPVIEEPVIIEPEVRHIHVPDNQTQNVHDHAVAASLRANVKTLKEEFPDMTYDRSEVIETTMDKLRNSGVPESSMGNIFRVLVSLVPDEISSIKCSQMDTLFLLTQKLDSIKDETLRTNAYETLGKNLKTGIERGHVVCSTGKISRIISTLEGLDIGMQKSVHMDIVKKEIATLASKIRNDILEESSDGNRKSYDSSDSGNLATKMSDRLSEEVQNTYVKELGMSKKILEPIISMYSSVY